MWESCCLKCIFRRSLKKKACMLIITMIRKIQKPITIVQRTVFYRLCGCASGVLIAVIWNCSMSIRHSLLHFGQKSGKFCHRLIFSDFVASFISVDRETHPLDTYFYLHLYFYFFLEYPITLTKYDETTIPKAKIAINIGFLTKF